MKIELSIIIVSFNTKKLLLECLDSITTHPPKVNCEIIVVDNASSDGTVETLAHDKRIVLITNQENLGFAKANNLGIKKASGEYILLLNSDIRVTQGSIDTLLKVAKERPDAGAVAARLLDPDSKVQPSVFRLPTLGRTIRQYWFGERGLLDKYTPNGEDVSEVEEAVMAAFLITPQSIKKVGLLNERYFMYFEDFDYCRRIRNSGLKIYYVPQAKVYHHHGASGRSLADEKNQWRRLIPGSIVYHGLVVHSLITFVIWTSQKWRKIFGKQ